MTRDETVPVSLRRRLDGHEVEQGFGEACPSCGREYAAGERLVVRSDRTSKTTGWEVPSVVCAECRRRSLSADERRTNADQILVSIEVVAAPMALVLDGDSIRLLDRAPGTD